MIERWPAEDMVVEILNQSVDGGGSACNFAVDIRKLDPDMPVDTIGVLGDDAFGAVLERVDRRERHRPPRRRDRPRRRDELHRRLQRALQRPAHASLPCRRQRRAVAGALRLRADAGAHPASRPAGHPRADGRPLGRRPERLGQRCCAPRGPPGWRPTSRCSRSSRSGCAGRSSPASALLDYLIINDFEVGALTGGGRSRTA